MRRSTLWTTAHDTKNRVVYYQRGRVRRVELSRIDFAATTELVRLPLDREKKQDIEDIVAAVTCGVSASPPATAAAITGRGSRCRTRPGARAAGVGPHPSRSRPRHRDRPSSDASGSCAPASTSLRFEPTE